MNFLNYIQKIEINPTEMCNLKCSFCPRGNGYPNQQLHISVDTIKELRRQLDESGYNRHVTLVGRGEPTLTHKFDEILDVLFDGNPKYTVMMTTNGRRLDEYLDYIPKFAHIKYDVYEKRRRLYFNQKIKWKKYSNVKVSHNPDFGVNYEEFNDIKEKEEWQRFSNRAGFLEDKKRNQWEKFPTCSFPFEKMYINWNGDYNLCCDDWNAIKMSNIFDETIEQFVNHNPKLEAVRNMLLEGKRDCGVCKGCDRISPLKAGIYQKINEHTHTKDR